MFKKCLLPQPSIKIDIKLFIVQYFKCTKYGNCDNFHRTFFQMVISAENKSEDTFSQLCYLLKICFN